MEVINQHHIRENGNIIHSIFLIREQFEVEFIRKPPYKYRIVASIPYPLQMKFYGGQPLVFIERAIAFKFMTKFIRFLDKRDLSQYAFTKAFPQSIKTSPLRLEKVKTLWYEDNFKIRIASETHCNSIYWALCSDLLSYSEDYKSKFREDCQSIPRKEFEGILEDDLMKAEYVNHYNKIHNGAFFKMNETGYQTYFAISKKGFPILFIKKPLIKAPN